MEKIYSQSAGKIRQNKHKLEKELNVKISFTGKTVNIEGRAVEEYLVSNIVEAMELGFTAEQALLLKDEEVIFEKINIKDITKRHDLARVRGRIIGTHGKTREHIEELSDCFVSVHDNVVGIIGKSEDIKKAIQAVTSIIQGSKQSKVYSYLERERAKSKQKGFDDDLGLRK